MSARKDLDREVRDAERRGWVVVRQRRHRVLVHPVHGSVVVSTTPRSGAAVVAVRRDFARHEGSA